MHSWGSKRFFRIRIRILFFRPIGSRLLSAPGPNQNAFGFGSKSKSTLKTLYNLKISYILIPSAQNGSIAQFFGTRHIVCSQGLSFLKKKSQPFQIHCFISKKTFKNVAFNPLKHVLLHKICLWIRIRMVHRIRIFHNVRILSDSDLDSDPFFRPIRIRIRLLSAPDPNAFGFGSKSKSTLKTKSN